MKKYIFIITILSSCCFKKHLLEKYDFHGNKISSECFNYGKYNTEDSALYILYENKVLVDSGVYSKGKKYGFCLSSVNRFKPIKLANTYYISDNLVQFDFLDSSSKSVITNVEIIDAPLSDFEIRDEDLGIRRNNLYFKFSSNKNELTFIPHIDENNKKVIYIVTPVSPSFNKYVEITNIESGKYVLKKSILNSPYLGVMDTADFKVKIFKDDKLIAQGSTREKGKTLKARDTDKED